MIWKKNFVLQKPRFQGSIRRWSISMEVVLPQRSVAGSDVSSSCFKEKCYGEAEVKYKENSYFVGRFHGSALHGDRGVACRVRILPMNQHA
jgi:hypothetical protein